MNILYFGARPKPSVTRMLDKEGYTIVHAGYKKGILASLANCTAVVLHWKSKRDQPVIAEAQAAGLPVMVITANLVDAYTAADPLADLYLEEPASDEDVAALLIDLITTGQVTGVVAITSRGMQIAA